MGGVTTEQEEIGRPVMLPEREDCAGGRSAELRCASTGSSNANSLPSPMALETSMEFPCMASSNFSLITSPSPVPELWFVPLECTCPKLTNSLDCSCALEMPIPVSFTEHLRR